MTQDSTLKITCHHCKQKLDVSSLEPFARINCPRCNTELTVPEWFDSYLLLEPGGCGGMASVYRAHDPTLDREVAIKILNPEYSSDPFRSAQFLQEARTAATVNHPAIVSIYTCGIYQGRSYIVMQYLAGGTLEEQLRRANGKLPVEAVTAWIRDVAEGLECAGKYGIVHHDIKPGNILLDVDGHARIGDFGLAQMIRTANTESPEQGAFSRFWISPNYVSPEKVRTNEEDYRGDIYSLGATFYHLLTGSTPFSHSDMDELIRMRLTENPMPPHFLRADINLELSQLIISMLAKKPEDRPSYRTIIGVLNRILKNHSVSTVPLPVKDIRISKAPVISKEQPSPAEPVGPDRKKLKILSLILLAQILLLIGMLYILDRKPWEQSERSTPREMLVNPAVSSCFAEGDPAKAASQAESVALDRTLTAKQRLLAVVQYAYALYLQKKPDPAKIKALLAKIELNDVQKKELRPWYIPLMQMSEPEKQMLITEREGASIPLMKMADFFILANREKSHDMILRSFRDLQRTLVKIPENHWIRLCFEQRFSLWQQIMEYGKTSHTIVEPLFRDHIRYQTSRSINPVETIEPIELNNDGSDGSAPELTAAILKKAAERYHRVNRPRPDAPGTLTRENTQEYLNSLPAYNREAESKRLIYMCNLIPYIVQASTDNPCRIKHFVALDGKNYWNGILLFNEKFISFKNDDGLERLEWSQLPSSEIQKILKYYVTSRENRLKASASREIQREIFAGYLRYTLFCQWYGDYAEAEKYAIQTLKYLPGKETNKLLTLMLLR